MNESGVNNAGSKDSQQFCECQVAHEGCSVQGCGTPGPRARVYIGACTV